MDHSLHQLAAFRDRHPLIGPVVWISSLQYFVTQLIVSTAFRPGYSWRYNTISDLGNTLCGPYGERSICSPAHTGMNASFIVLGLTMMIGASFIYKQFNRHKGAKVGFTGIALAGFGTVLVGLFPENTVSQLHVTGAALPFVVGNLSLILLSLRLPLSKLLRIYTIVSGIVATIALILFLHNSYFGLGEGGMERLTAYPQTIWLIIFGGYMIATRQQRTKR